MVWKLVSIVHTSERHICMMNAIYERRVRREPKRYRVRLVSNVIYDWWSRIVLFLVCLYL